MSTAAFIEFLEGPLGNGKSLHANIRAFRFLEQGGVVALNYPLIKDWAWKHAVYCQKPWDTEESILKRAVSFYERVFSFGSHESLIQLSKMVPHLVTGRKAKQYEGWALAVFDEASLMFNSRDWQRNFPYIQFFIGARKYKFECLLVSHDREDIDVQLQRKCEIITSVRNMYRRSFAGIPVSVFTKKQLFRTLSTVAGRGAGKGESDNKGWFKMNHHIRELYNSSEIFTSEVTERPLGAIGEHPEKTYERIKRERNYSKLISVGAASVLPADYFWRENIGTA